MPKLYGEFITEEKMRVDIISYSGNRAGGIEVDEVLEGEGIHYVNPLTKAQWYEKEREESKPAQSEGQIIAELKTKLEELQTMVGNLVGD